MKRLNFLLIALVAVSATSCYDSFEKDYDVTRAYFASQRPLRTLVADTDMSIKVGVAIGGVREVDPDDWATFEIDPSLLEGTGLTLMPQEYYQLADPDRMTVSNTNLAICDVRVTFSDGLYDDEDALGVHYAIPFRLTGHTHDEIATDVNGNLKNYSIVAVKFVSRWNGTYYMKGQVRARSPTFLQGKCLHTGTKTSAAVLHALSLPLQGTRSSARGSAVRRMQARL